jgi:hypothetical protein
MIVVTGGKRKAQKEESNEGLLDLFKKGSPFFSFQTAFSIE